MLRKCFEFNPAQRIHVNEASRVGALGLAELGVLNFARSRFQRVRIGLATAFWEDEDYLHVEMLQTCLALT